VKDLMMSREYGLVDLSDIDSICKGLAIKTIGLPMAHQFRGPAKYFIDEFAIKGCQDYKADVALLIAGMACRNPWAMGKLVKDALWDELKIRTLILEIDIGDPRIVSSEEMRGKVGDFFSIISKT